MSAAREPRHGRCYVCRMLTTHFVPMLGLYVCDTCSPIRRDRVHTAKEEA